MTAAGDIRNLPATVSVELPKKFSELLVHPAAREIIEPMVPRGVEYREIVQETLFAIDKNPELKECTILSLLRAVGRAAQTGLVIGETVHLVPFNTNVGTKQNPRWEKRCERLIGYRGKIELVKRAGGARLIYAEPVFEREVADKLFKYEQGTEPRIFHQPIMDPDDRGPMVAAYAVARVSMYDIRVVVQSIKQIEEVRKLSKLCSPEKVKVCPDWWARKRLVHLITKELPMNDRMRHVARMLDEDHTDEVMDGEPIAVVEQPAA